MSAVEIKHLDIRTEGAGPDVEYVVDDFLRGARNEDRNLGGGEDCGAVVVRIGVDGDFDRVQADLGQTGDLEGIDRAIAALTRAREELAALYDARRRGRLGRCLVHADWGRCYGAQGHEGEHRFPSEEDGLSLLGIVRSAS